MFFLGDLLSRKTTLPGADKALPGRPEPIMTPGRHAVLKVPLAGPYPEGSGEVLFGMGCFWGAERLFWKTPGVHVTMVGYAGGHTPNPTYQETCTGMTGHAEVVRVIHDPVALPFSALLKLFFEEHDPTQGMRQGNDVGTVYRSAIYCTTDAQVAEATKARDDYQAALEAAGHKGRITTEIARDRTFYFAEDYHQQYLAKNPGGYCGLQGTGVSCAVGGVAA